MPEVVGQCAADPVAGVHLAGRESLSQSLRGDVDQLDLVGVADDVVGNRLALDDSRDLLNNVVQALQMLDVDRGEYVDSGVAQRLDILPAFGVAGSGRVGVGQLVHQRHPRCTCQNGIRSISSRIVPP